MGERPKIPKETNELEDATPNCKFGIEVVPTAT
jgi:hypothetical protein